MDFNYFRSGVSASYAGLHKKRVLSSVELCEKSLHKISHHMISQNVAKNIATQPKIEASTIHHDVFCHCQAAVLYKHFFFPKKFPMATPSGIDGMCFSHWEYMDI